MSKLNLFKKDNDVCIKEALTEENIKIQERMTTTTTTTKYNSKEALLTQ